MKDKPRLSRFGEPATLILTCLVGEPMHGYGIMTECRERLGFEIGPGTLYASIAKLIKLGLIEPVPSEERSRPYKITAEGRRELEIFFAKWGRIVRAGEARLA